MQTGKLRQSELIAAVASGVMFISLFFKWAGVNITGVTVNGLNINVPGVSFSGSGWHYVTNTRWLILITAIVAIGLAVMKMTDQELALPIPGSAIVTTLAGLSTVFIIYRIIHHPHVSLKFGIFVGLVAGLAATYGAYRSMAEEGTSFRQAAEGMQPGPASGSPGPPPPPPAATPPPPPPPA